MFKGGKKLIILTAAIITSLALIAGGYLAYNESRDDKGEDITTQQSATTNISTITVEVDGSTNTFTQEFNEGDTAFDVLMKLANTNREFTFEYDEYEGMGVFVTSVVGVIPDQTHFWSTYINGQQMQVGVSSYTMKNNDALGLKYEEIIF